MNNCPRDHAGLASNDVDGYRYYSCDRCHGMWLPGRVVHRILSEQGLQDLRSLTISGASEIVCPDCRQGCQTLTVHGCTLDVCQQCHGIWLDPGEVERLELLFPQDSAVVDAARSASAGLKGWTGIMVIDAAIQILLTAAHLK